MKIDKNITRRFLPILWS